MNGQLSHADLGWMAGVLEIRGRIRRPINQKRKTPQLILQVRTKHTKVVARLCRLTGVQSRTSKPKEIDDFDRKGCIEHCPEPHVHLSRHIESMAVWAVTGTASAIVLDNLYPYLSDTDDLGDYIDEVITYVPTSGRGRHAIALSTERLRSLGWQIPPELDHIASEAYRQAMRMAA